MVRSIGHGSVRQVWFAPKADPNAKSSFLIRDDAYSKQGLTTGRTVRLGDPVDLGPYSTWRQDSWVGGEGQERWSDPEMFHKGTLDTFRKNGKVRLHRALGDISVTVTGRNVSSLTLGRNTTVVDRNTPVILMAGESTYYTGGATPSGGFRMYAAKRGFATVTLKTDLDSSVMSMSPVADSYSGIFVGLANGKVWAHQSTGNTWNLHHTFSSAAPVWNIESFGDATYFLVGERVWRRTFDGTTATFTQFFRPPGGKLTRGVTTWNNRMWFASMSYGRTTTVYVTDGVFTVPAFTFPGEFECMGMTNYQGSLYIYGSRPGADGTSFQGQIWRYTGSSLSLLHTQGTGLDGNDNTIWDAVVDQETLYWTRSGFADNDWTAGLNAYRSDTDSIHTGPIEREFASPTIVRSVDIYDQTVACAIYNATANEVRARPASQDENVKRSASQVLRSMYSSVYDADLSNEKKTWVRARVRIKIPGEGGEAELLVVPNESGVETSLGVITYDSGNTGFRTVSLPVLVSGNYLQSYNLQYVLKLRNTLGTFPSLVTPEVDSVEFDFMPSPQRRRQWRIRAFSDDAQSRLDGTANPLATTVAIENKLEEFWGDGAPILFWDATTATGTPTGDPVEVIFTDFLAQSYRVDTADDAVASEVSVGFYEVVA